MFLIPESALSPVIPGSVFSPVKYFFFRSFFSVLSVLSLIFSGLKRIGRDEKHTTGG